MQRRQGPGLSLAEWLVLCLVSEEPAHGFALALLLAPHGSVGKVWHVRKAVVYRAVQRLERLGLITAEGKQHTSQGPPRALLSATPEGHLAAQGWLRQPAAHPRDVRSELLVKLALLSRIGADPRDLLLAQRQQLIPVAEGLARQLCTVTGSGPDAVAARIGRRHPAVHRRPPGRCPRTAGVRQRRGQWCRGRASR
jgi:DNA-binding PadR family transcriptional regulator